MFVDTNGNLVLEDGSSASVTKDGLGNPIIHNLNPTSVDPADVGFDSQTGSTYRIDD